eukprot:scaffold53308_cov17-Prasinocladus_malaysianus.AAC.1
MEDNAPVALKLMQQPEQFLKEVQLRLQYDLEKQFVVQALRVHVDPGADGATEICERLRQLSLKSAGQIEVFSDTPFGEEYKNAKGDSYR